MNIKYLEYFTRIVESGSYAAVARRAFISQPGLHKAMRSLEDSLGVALIQQQEHKTVITEAGLALYPLAKQLLEDYDKITNAMKNFSDTSQKTIRLGFCSPAIDKRFSSFVLEFMEQHAECELTMIPGPENRIRQLLLSDRLEFGLFIASPEDDMTKFHICDLGSSSWGIIVASDDPLAGKPSIRIADLAGHTIMLPTYDNYWTDSVNRLLAEAEFEPGQSPTIVKMLDNMWLNYARRRKAVFFAQESKWRYSDNVGINYVPLEGDPLHFTLRLIRRKGRRLSEVETLFWNGVIELSRDITEAATTVDVDDM